MLYISVLIWSTNKIGLESILTGLVNDQASKADTSVADTLLNHLFEVIAPNGTYIRLPTDLPATNINRGRDHGVPSYTNVRKFCGLKVPRTFSDLSNEMTSDSIAKLKSVYKFKLLIYFFINNNQ